VSLFKLLISKVSRNCALRFCTYVSDGSVRDQENLKLGDEEAARWLRGVGILRIDLCT
jgi:hypothetical protein